MNCRLSKRYFVFALIAASLLAAAPAGAYLPPKFGGALTVAIPERISRLDPALMTQDHEFMIASCLFDTLVAPGPGGGFVPALLDALPEKSDDGLTYYFKLREGIEFHDGSRLDAADVLETFKRLVKSRRSPYSWLLKDVEGVDEFKANKSGTITGFKITDPIRFEVRLKRQQPNFTKYLCFPALAIVPTTIGRDFNPPIGTGPFKYAGVSKGGVATLTANADYFLGRPYLDSVVFRPVLDERDRLTEFRRGAVDVTEEPEAGLSRTESELFGPAEVSPLRRIYFLDVNTAGAAFYMPGQRQALSRAADRAGIVRVILSGNGDEENNVPGAGDPRALRKSAEGMKNIVLRCPERNAALGLIAKKLQRDFKKAGVEAKVDPRPSGALLEYSSDEAPSFILRSLPELMGLRESVEMALFASGPSSAAAAMDRRLGPSRDEKSKPPFGAVIALFSQRRAFIAQKNVFGLDFGPFGAPALDSAYVRTPPAVDEKQQAGGREGAPKKSEKGKTEKK